MNSDQTVCSVNLGVPSFLNSRQCTDHGGAYDYITAAFTNQAFCRYYGNNQDFKKQIWFKNQNTKYKMQIVNFF